MELTATRPDPRTAEAARARALARLRRRYPFNPSTHPLGRAGDDKHIVDVASVVAEVDAALAGDHRIDRWHPNVVRVAAAELIGCPLREVDDHLDAYSRERLNL